jgi:hypothetical protein
VPIVIDTLTLCMGAGEENSNADAVRVTRREACLAELGNADLNLPRSVEAKFPTLALSDQPVSDRWLRSLAACRAAWAAVVA